MNLQSLVSLPRIMQLGCLSRKLYLRHLYHSVGIENMTDEDLLLCVIMAYAGAVQNNEILYETLHNIRYHSAKLVSHIYYNFRMAVVPKHAYGALDHFLEAIFSSIKQTNEIIHTRKIEIKRKLLAIDIYERTFQLLKDTEINRQLFLRVINKIADKSYTHAIQPTMPDNVLHLQAAHHHQPQPHPYDPQEFNLDSPFDSTLAPAASDASDPPHTQT